ncbi:MAG TPA: FXSXX-COOH protein [Streptosporangiaceae bacterium]|nr:FXSXX-COOH protein [Streptosporangiaceae bacterium]
MGDDPDTSAAGSGLIDVSALSLQELDKSDESCLEHALRWVLSSGQGGGEPIAGFGNST